jgi:hypothetical protein
VPALAVRLYNDPEVIGLHRPRLLPVCHTPVWKGLRTSRIRPRHSRMWIRYKRKSLADMVSESYRFGEDSVADVRMNRAAFDHVDVGP